MERLTAEQIYEYFAYAATGVRVPAPPVTVKSKEPESYGSRIIRLRPFSCAVNSMFGQIYLFIALILCFQR